jgi:4-carboxymuconolactone decarboxylase
MADSVSRPDILASLAIPAEIRADAEALSPAQRSLMSLSTLGALGRTEQFRVHVGMALDNGLTRHEICEVILQLGIYAGMPAAVTGFRIASEVFAERDAS